jgi:hypothetical protein
MNIKKSFFAIFGAITLGAVLGVGLFYLTAPAKPLDKAKKAPQFITPVPEILGSTTSAVATVSASASAIPRSLGEAPVVVTQKYFAAYKDCSQGVPNSACIANARYASATLQQSVASRAVSGVDPVLCTSSAPQTVAADRPTITGDTASTYVTTNNLGNGKSILVHLSAETGQWRIVDIICPKL